MRSAAERTRRARHYLRIPVHQNQFDMNAYLLTKYRQHYFGPYHNFNTSVLNYNKNIRDQKISTVLRHVNQILLTAIGVERA